MKRVMHILNYFAVLTIMVACSQPTKVEAPEPCRSVAGPTQELAAIDTLMWRQPDSAFAMLQEFAGSEEADSMGVFEGHYCQVLVAELLFKNDYGQSNREEVLKAVHYFDSIVGMDGADARGVSAQKDAFLAARAHYMNGVGCYERDSIIAACKAYLKALELMETHFPDLALQRSTATYGTTALPSNRLLWFMDLTYCRLEGLFSKQFMQEPAIVCGKRAIAIDTICPFDSYNTPALFLNLGLQYNKLYELNKEPYLADTAEYYFNEALRHLPDTNNRLFIDVVTQLELLKINKGQDFEPSIIVLKRIAAQTLDETERLCSYLAIGGIYHSYIQYDSALVYLTPVFENKKDPYRQKVVAPYLHEIYLNTGDTVKAALFARYIVDNTATEGESNAQVSTLNDLFQQHLQWEQDRAKAEKHHKKSVRLYVLLASLLVVVLLIGLFVYSYRKRKEAEATRLREAQHQLKAELEQSSQHQRNMLQQRALAIYQSGGDDRLQRILDEFESAYPSATVKLEQACPNLNKTELRIVILSLLGFRAKEVADLLGLKENTVTQYRSNLKKKADIDGLSASIW